MKRQVRRRMFAWKLVTSMEEYLFNPVIGTGSDLGGSGGLAASLSTSIAISFCCAPPWPQGSPLPSIASCP